MLSIKTATINFKLIDGNAINKGTDWNIDMSIADRVDNVDTAIDLSNCTGICTIKTDANSEVIVASPTFTLTNAPEGCFSISLTELETSIIPTTGDTYKDITKYQYELMLMDGSDTYRALQGYIEVSPTIITEEI